MQTEALTMDGVPYELVAYPVAAEQFAAEWRCKKCDETDGVAIRADTLKNALDIARFSLIAHHQVSHQGVAKLIDLGSRYAAQETIGERRSEDRDQAAVRMRVAYACGGMLPSDDELLEVECQNLSRSGLAFWIGSTPQHKDLLVVLGESRNEVRARARVVHSEPVQYQGRRCALVGCQFWGRL